MTVVLRSVVAFVFVASSASAGFAEEIDLRRARKIAALIRYLESELKSATERLDRQSGSPGEVDSIHADLAKARHDLAVVNNNDEEILRQCDVLISVRNRQLGRQVKLNQRGFGSRRELTIAIRRLAGARYRRAQARNSDALPELRQVVQLCNEELKLLADLQTDGAASAMEVNRARHRAIIAEYCLARWQDDKPSVVKPSVVSKVTKAVEHSDDELKKIRHLHQQGFADAFDIYFAQRTLLNAKLLLANLETDSKAVGAALGELVQIHSQLAPRFESDRRGRLLRAFVENERERDRSRMEQYQRDGSLADELSLGELGF
ncbi:MAG: hypothetical protein AAFU85_03570 [Planctomycetota bacterium]